MDFRVLLSVSKSKKRRGILCRHEAANELVSTNLKMQLLARKPDKGDKVRGRQAFKG